MYFQFLIEDKSTEILVNHVMDKMQKWLLGDAEAIKKAYPNARMQCIKKYEQDAICETWEVLADMVYPKGVSKLKKKSGDGYAEIGKAKCEWADQIGRYLDLHNNQSPSYQCVRKESLCIIK